MITKALTFLELSPFATSSAKTFCSNLFKGKFVEEFYIICLSSSNKVLDCKRVNKGTASEVAIDIRSLTNIALANQCERIIISHNHPNGKARPSDEDIAFTSKILFSCIINNIEVLDHIIVSNDDSFSFEESQLLSDLKTDVIRKLPMATKYKHLSEGSRNYVIG